MTFPKKQNYRNSKKIGVFQELFVGDDGERVKHGIFQQGI